MNDLKKKFLMSVYEIFMIRFNSNSLDKIPKK